MSDALHFRATLNRSGFRVWSREEVMELLSGVNTALMDCLDALPDTPEVMAMTTERIANTTNVQERKERGNREHTNQNLFGVRARAIAGTTRTRAGHYRTRCRRVLSAVRR